MLRRVPVEGLESLEPDMRSSLVPDPDGFISATREPYFGARELCDPTPRSNVNTPRH